MIVVQRVVTYWTKQSRGGGAATRRNAVPETFPVHAPGSTGVLVHEVDAHERDGFTPSHTMRTVDRPTHLDGDATAVCNAVAPVTHGVFLTETDGRLRVVVSPPAARSPAHGPRQLFTLEPGQRGRWRFNGRFIPNGCSCHSHQWWYEKWVVNVAHVRGTPASNVFTQCEPNQVVDNLVRLF